MKSDDFAEPDHPPSGWQAARARLEASPHLIVPGLVAWLRGWWYRIKFFLQFKRFSAGKLFRVYGPLVISGPGQVRFGDNCLIISNAIKPVCIRTLTPHAQMSLGDNAGLNGTSIQCAESVSIGAWSNIADAYITDSPAHTINKDRRQKSIDDVTNAPVRIENNVWVSVQVVISHGVTIGENSVIGACSLVRESVPANVFGAGNPFSVIREIAD
jgi:acetyltransferase-like isoleucine patch superfamily enzyme